MAPFNNSLIDQWKNTGYRFILVLPRDKYGVLRPLINDKPVSKGYTIAIEEMSLLQMAEDYFITKEKDAFISSARRSVA